MGRAVDALDLDVEIAVRPPLAIRQQDRVGPRLERLGRDRALDHAPRLGGRLAPEQKCGVSISGSPSLRLLGVPATTARRSLRDGGPCLWRGAGQSSLCPGGPAFLRDASLARGSGIACERQPDQECRNGDEGEAGDETQATDPGPVLGGRTGCAPAKRPIIPRLHLTAWGSRAAGSRLPLRRSRDKPCDHVSEPRRDSSCKIRSSSGSRRCAPPSGRV
jgi:hypothetical protein